MPESTTTNPEQEHRAEADASAPPATLEEQVEALLDRMDQVAEETAREHNVTVKGEPLGVDGADAAEVAVSQGVVTDSGVKAAPAAETGDKPEEGEPQVEVDLETVATEESTDEFDEAEPPDGDFEDPSALDEAVGELVEQAEAVDPALEASVDELVEAAQPPDAVEDDVETEAFEAPDELDAPRDDPAPRETAEPDVAMPAAPEESVQDIDDAIAAEVDEMSWESDGSEDDQTESASAETQPGEVATAEAVDEAEDEEGLVDLPSMQIAVGDDSSWKGKRKPAEEGEDAPDDEPPSDEIDADFEAIDDLEHEPIEGEFETPEPAVDEAFEAAVDEQPDAIIEHGPRPQDTTSAAASPAESIPAPAGEAVETSTIDTEAEVAATSTPPSAAAQTVSAPVADTVASGTAPEAAPPAAPAAPAEATDSLIAKVRFHVERVIRMAGPAVQQVRQHAPQVWARIQPAVRTGLYWLNWPYRQIPAEYRDTVGWLAAVTAFMAIVVWFIALR